MFEPVHPHNFHIDRRWGSQRSRYTNILIISCATSSSKYSLQMHHK
jgi:hypothetical protein